ncbi:helix-turn-helix domain-containing protein [Noviherbaspirillum malthae]|uniref:helix-turn-helix domain-containing protein n=1 Tax=Noviherbaspirillum malthae TaxID=1260987 RepID=UPI0018903CCE|nr:RodZ domain-containing protein [Noviherbaspirillum malthae]
MSEPGLNDQAMPGDADKEAPIAVSPGARLAACRQERGWTIEQVAGQLNLAPRQVVAIEADDYPSLPGMAIVRGFVRQYAKLLKIDAAPLLASLGGETVLAHEPIRPRQNLSTPFSEARLPSMTNSRSKVSAKWIMAGIVVVAVGAVAYGLRQGVDFAGLTQSAGSQVKEGASQIITPSAPASQGDAAPAASDSAAAPEPVNAQPPVEPSAPSAGQPGEAANPQAAAPAVPPAPATQQGGAATSQAAGTPAATGAAVPAPAVPASAAQPPSPSAPAAAAVPQAAPANTGNTLVIKARQDSWIEIKAAGSARPVISRVVKAGETESFEVTDTVAVVVGNASGVDATLRGNPVDLKATGNGNVARITLK